MKTIRQSLLVAAVMSTALAASAQSPGGQNPGAGSTGSDTSNETQTTNPTGSGTRTPTPGGRVDGRQGVNTDINTGADANTTRSTNGSADTEVNTVNQDTDRGMQPAKKRSFWDRIRGRNKGMDADRSGTGTRPAETDASGRRQDRTGDYQP